MSRLIRLSESLHVAADQVVEVRVISDHHSIAVKMRDGTTHTHLAGYKESVYAAQDKLLFAINAALEGATP